MGTEAVVLAAGLSSRAHKYKMALDFNGSTVIENCIVNMYDVVDKIIVVGGYNFSLIESIVSKYKKVKLIYNDKYESGMFSSVRLGINSVISDNFFLIPGDYALVDDYVYLKMLDYKSDASIIIPSYKGKKGHPVLFKDSSIKSAINHNFNNLREVINYIGFETLEVDRDGILYDIDTYEDYIIALEKKLIKEGMKKAGY